MRYFIIVLILLSCSSKVKENVQENDKLVNDKGNKYSLIQDKCIEFRRNYFSDPAIEKNDKLMYKFMNRNPERGFAYDTIFKKYENGFTKLNLLDSAGDFNLKSWEKISTSKITGVTIKIKGDSYILNIGDSYHLEISDVDKSIIASADLKVKSQPSTSFYIYDLNADGLDEIIVMENWYIINGDNYDFSILEIIEN